MTMPTDQDPDEPQPNRDGPPEDGEHGTDSEAAVIVFPGQTDGEGDDGAEADSSSFVVFVGEIDENGLDADEADDADRDAEEDGDAEEFADPEPASDKSGEAEDFDEDGDDGDDEPVDEDGDEAGGDDGPELPFDSVVEAILFASREPLKAAQIARAVGRGIRQNAVREAMDRLNLFYLENGRAFEIAEISERFQLMSRPEYVSHLKRLYPKDAAGGDKGKTQRLTPAALDTLSIIAYKQPVTRAEIERVRGVGCGPVLRSLIERGTVKVAGKRADLIGQPLTYGTTEAFLVEFGLGSLDELPLRNEFQSSFSLLDPDPAGDAITADVAGGSSPSNLKDDPATVPDSTPDDADSGGDDGDYDENRDESEAGDPPEKDDESVDHDDDDLAISENDQESD